MPVFTGTSGDDSIVGSVSADTIDGGLGNDTLDGGGGSDSFQGGGGDDVVNVTPAAGVSDIVDGGAGSDVLNLGALGSGAAFSFQTAANSHFTLGVSQGGGAFGLNMVNVETAHVAAGSLASATFTANTAASYSLLLLQSGSQLIFEGSNVPVVTLDNLAAGATLRIVTGSGADTLDASRVGANGHAQILDSGAGADTLVVMNSTALAGAGDDTVDWFFGGSGSIDGGTGNDVENITFGGGADTATLSASGGHVRETLDGATQDVVGVETINIATGDRADTVSVGDLSGTAATKVNIDLSGATAGQADGAVDAVTLAGARAGGQVTTTFSADHTSAQVVYTVGGAVVETVNITHADAQDTLQVGSGPIQHFGSTPGVFIGTNANDVITPALVSAGVFGSGRPGPEANTIDGGLGDDSLDGGGGNDSLQGGGGDDQITVAPAAGASDTVDGGSGTDVLNLGSLGSSAAFSLQTAANGHFNLGLAQGGGAFGLDLVNLETVHVAAGSLSSATFTADTAPSASMLVLQSGSQVVVEGSNVPVVALDNLAAGAVLRVVTGAGNDLLDATRVGPNGHAQVLDAGAGNDTLLVMNSTALAGAGDDAVNWFFGGSGSIDGGAGNDVENITFGGGADTATLSASNGHVIENLDGSTEDVVGVETINIATGDRADSITAGDLTGTGVAHLNIQAGQGADLVVLNELTTPSAQTTVDLSGAIAGQGDGAVDLVRFVSSASADTIATLGLPGGGYQIVEPNVFNQVQIAALDATDKIEIDAGAGDDRINLDLSAPVAGMTVDGGSGFDIVSGFLENTPDTVTITGNHLSHGAMAADLVGVEALNLNIVGNEGGTNNFVVNGGAGADFYADSSAAGSMTVFQSAGPTINIGGFNFFDHLEIHAGGGDDELDWNGNIFSFDGGDGSDLVKLNTLDAGSLSFQAGQLQVFRQGGFVDLQNVEHLQMSGNASGANFVILDLAGSGLTQVDVQLSNQSRVFLAATVGAHTLNFAETSTTITANGMGAPITLHDWNPFGDVLVVQLGNSNDQIDGGGLALMMTVTGGGGDDVITGGINSNRLSGEDGSDTLTGKGVGDILDGGDGNDVLFGGGGADVFRISAGIDTILDFQSHFGVDVHDRIDMSGLPFAHSFADLVSQHLILQAGEDVLVALDVGFNNFMVLKNMHLSLLNEPDFIFT